MIKTIARCAILGTLLTLVWTAAVFALTFVLALCLALP